MKKHSIQVALQLAQMPWLGRELRSQPVPDDILDLIKIAAGCVDTCREMESLTGRSTGVLRIAAKHYLHVALFFPGAPSPRIFGLRGEEPHETMLLHKRWLIKWLHPDRNGDVWESAHMARVLAAWSELTTDPAPIVWDRSDARFPARLKESSSWQVTGPLAVPAPNWIANTPRNENNFRVFGRLGVAITVASALAFTGMGALLLLQDSFLGEADARIAFDGGPPHVWAKPNDSDAPYRCAEASPAACNSEMNSP